MTEIQWNGGVYREGGTLLYQGEVKVIQSLEVNNVPTGRSIFDRMEVLKITTTDGKIIESFRH